MRKTCLSRLVEYRKIVFSALQTDNMRSVAQNCPSVVVLPCCRLQIHTWFPGLNEVSEVIRFFKSSCPVSMFSRPTMSGRWLYVRRWSIMWLGLWKAEHLAQVWALAYQEENKNWHTKAQNKTCQAIQGIATVVLRQCYPRTFDGRKGASRYDGEQLLFVVVFFCPFPGAKGVYFRAWETERPCPLLYLNF